MYEEKLKKYIEEKNIQTEHFSFNESCHSVEEAAKVVNCSADDFVKNICMLNEDGSLIVAIIKGEDKASTTRVGEVLNIQRPRMTTLEEILEKTGYPCGGTPSFGYDATFLIDERVMEKEFVYTGGGSENSLLKISTKELLGANGAQVHKIRR